MKKRNDLGGFWDSVSEDILGQRKWPPMNDEAGVKMKKEKVEWHKFCCTEATAFCSVALSYHCR